MAKTALQFRHNGRDVAVFVDGGANLLTALRDGVGDMSPKFGCGQGTCGACTVLIDGEAHLSCLTLAETVGGPLGRDARRPQGRAEPASAAARLHGAFRRAVRLLHAGHADGGQSAARPQSRADARGGGRRDLRQHLPLHRLRADHQRRSRRRLRRPRTRLEDLRHAGTAQGHFRRRARRQSQGDRQGHPAPGHARPCHRHVDLFQRPQVAGPAASARCCAARMPTRASAASTPQRPSARPACAASSAAPTCRATSTRCSA